MGGIVRGYIIPKIIGEHVVYSENVSGIEVKVLDTLHEIIQDVLMDVCRSLNRKIESVDDLNHFLNLYVLYLKTILYRDAIEGILLSPVKGQYFHYMEKHIRNKACMSRLTEEEVKEYTETLVDEVEIISKKFKPIDVDTLLKFPADTRIGLNTSGLIIHFLTVSSIASSIYLNDYEDKYDLVKIRFLSLFHDLGKLQVWKRHEEKSADLIEKWILNSGSIVEGSEAWKLIEDVITILKEGIFEDKCYRIFKIADKVASQIDRIKKAIELSLSEESKEEFIRKVEEYLVKKGVKVSFKDFGEAYKEIENDGYFWNEFLSVSDIMKYTDEFCKNISRITIDNKVITSFFEKGELIEEVKGKVCIVRFDFSGIQSFIWTNDVRSIMGGSRIVDFVIYVFLPCLLMNLGLPYESVLIFGGGNLTAIIPFKYIDKINEQLKNIKLPGVRINIGFSQIYDNYMYMNREIERSLRLSKQRVDVIRPISLEIFHKCDFCGREIASEYIKDKDVKVCGKCKFKYEIGDMEYFKVRSALFYIALKSEEKIAKIAENLMKGDLLVFMAGHKLEESKETLKEYNNLSLIRFDGNIIGQFICSAVSITDLFERSVRIDKAVKDAVNEFFGILKSVLGEEDALRFCLGILYVGGDDGTLIMPSLMSIPFSLYLLQRYYLSLGGKSTLSVALISAKPKHPIIPLYETVGYMLDKYSKENTGRILTYEECHSKVVDKLSSRFRGAITFLNIDVGRISPSYLDDIFESLYNDRSSIMFKHAYTLSSTTESYSILRLLNSLNIFNSNDVDDINYNFVIEWVKKFATPTFKKEYLKKLVGIEKLARDIMSATILGETSVEIRIVYGGSHYENNMLLSNLLLREKGRIFLCTSDLISLIKVLTGG